jgi:hypothetical protein
MLLAICGGKDIVDALYIHIAKTSTWVLTHWIYAVDTTVFTGNHQKLDYRGHQYIVVSCILWSKTNLIITSGPCIPTGIDQYVY